jgi:hypothetical protein
MEAVSKEGYNAGVWIPPVALSSAGLSQALLPPPSSSRASFPLHRDPSCLFVPWWFAGKR